MSYDQISNSTTAAFHVAANNFSQASTRSEAQAAASRFNGAQSHGPYTAAGKAASSRNAISHALRVKTSLVNNRFYTESTEDLETLLEELEEEYQPFGYRERALLRECAMVEIISSRPLIYQAAVIEQRMNEIDSQLSSDVRLIERAIHEKAEDITLMERALQKLKAIQRGEASFDNSADGFRKEDLLAVTDSLCSQIRHDPGSATLFTPDLLVYLEDLGLRSVADNLRKKPPIAFSRQLRKAAAKLNKSDDSEFLSFWIAATEELRAYASAELERMRGEVQKLKDSRVQRVQAALLPDQHQGELILRYGAFYEKRRAEKWDEFFRAQLFACEKSRRQRNTAIDTTAVVIDDVPQVQGSVTERTEWTAERTQVRRPKRENHKPQRKTSKPKKAKGTRG